MTSNVLLLNADYSPLKILSWEKAVCLILSEKASLVQGYSGRLIRSASLEMEWPAVVALKKYVKQATKVKFSRSNVMARDSYQCQYCGVKPKTTSGKPDLSQLTLEHIVPRSRAVQQGYYTKVQLPWNGKWVGVTCWENIAAACIPCNQYKGARTPSEAGMTLRRRPQVPNALDIVRMSFLRASIPSEWKEYLPETSQWRDYWDVELE